MLHKIKLVCESEFEWIIGLQRDLLKGVCDPKVNADTVTINWVKGLRPVINTHWMEKFCNRKDRLNGVGRSLLRHLQVIAGFNAGVKGQILKNFENNHNFKNAFDPDREQAHPLKPLNAVPYIELVKALRGFFTTFYDPSLYQQYGFPVLAGGEVVKFTRDCFLKNFYSENRNLGVCVLCDGDLGDPDIDHFYSKKVYPDLSCHPANLVPICKTCNSRARKGEKAPLDEGMADPMCNWFHPYYRTAEGRFSVDFKEKGNKIFPVLKTMNLTDQKRLDNLDNLVGLSSRWRRNLIQLIQRTAKRYRGTDLIELQAKLFEEAENMAFEIKHMPWAILREGFYRKVAEGYKPLLDELRVEIGKLDPVTATE
jgi:hypothetical protein